MIDSGLFISANDYRAMDGVLRAKLQEWLEGKTTSNSKPLSSLKEPDNAPDGSTDEHSSSDLSIAQARKFLEGCGDKTKAVLRAIFARSERKFMLKGLLNEMQVTSLAGVWSGVTKRIHTVLGDKDASMFSWEWDDEKDDWVASTSPMTFQSMRKALSIE